MRALLVVFCLAALSVTAGETAPRTLTFEDRVKAQEAIERVYYSHQIGATAPFEEAVPKSVRENKVRRYLEQTVALESYWRTAVTDEMLQRELERMVRQTKMPERLREIFASLDNDSFRIKECLARPTLVERLTRDRYAFDPMLHANAQGRAEDLQRDLVSNERSPDRSTGDFAIREAEADRPFEERLPCTPDHTWDSMGTTNLPTPHVQHTAVWTGSLMIIWGGSGSDSAAWRYDPATDTWSRSSILNAPPGNVYHTAVWTGNVMVVWGGSAAANTGGRYDPIADTWAPTSTVSAPSGRHLHTAVWTGNVMVVWGGVGSNYDSPFDTGGRYDPATDTWTPTSTVGAPSARYYHTAVWTGSLMIVWGGTNFLDTGGRYDPIADTWTPTSTVNSPPGSYLHTAIWTGHLMVVWSGRDAMGVGGRYDPIADTWTPTSTGNAPSGRYDHTAVWTGHEMVVWGGHDATSSSAFNTGGRYDPIADTWTSTSTVNAPSGRWYHTASWTGSLMVVWGGYAGSSFFNTGGRYVLGASVDNDGDGYSECDADCNDSDPAIYPGAPQLCDGKNNNCSDPSWPAVSANEADADRDGFRICAGDCNDNDVTVYPSAPQLCDGKNNNCSDPSWPAVSANEADADHDGFRICAGDCNDNDVTVYPSAPQLCDGKNNNCSDPSWPPVSANEADADGDTCRICAADCNDANAAVHPGAPEICNGIDDNCNGEVDEDASGADSDGDGVRNTCDNCRLAFNPDQLDSDSDLAGNSCDNCALIANADQADTDADHRGNACDNCIAAYNPFQDDFDLDSRGDACDNCVFDSNPSQSDFDHDNQGDLCDVNDGLIYLYSGDQNHMEWQAETGFTSWNSYKGDLAVLKATGIYTQAPGSNGLARRECGLTKAWVEDLDVPDIGQAAFFLTTGVVGGVESSLGTTAAGLQRQNTNPCP